MTKPQAARETLRPDPLTPEHPLTPEEHAALDALNAAEARFWKAEATWADKGSGMTRDQMTGAHMAFVWLRTTRPVALRATLPDPAEPGLMDLVGAVAARWYEGAPCWCPEDAPPPIHVPNCAALRSLAAGHRWYVMGDEAAATTDPAEPPIVAGIARCHHGAPLHACLDMPTSDRASTVEPGLREALLLLVSEAEILVDRCYGYAVDSRDLATAIETARAALTPDETEERSDG